MGQDESGAGKGESLKVLGGGWRIEQIKRKQGGSAE